MDYQSEKFLDLLGKKYAPNFDNTTVQKPDVLYGVNGMQLYKKDDIYYDDEGHAYQVDPNDSDNQEDKEYGAIMFPESFTEDLERFLTTVEDVTILFKEYSHEFVFVAPKKDIDAYIEKYQTPNHVANGEIKQMEKCVVPVGLINCIKMSRNDISRVFENTPLQTRINFMYLLGSDNFITDKQSKNQSGFNRVVQRVILNKLKEIKEFTFKELKEVYLDKLYSSLILNPNILNKALRQYKESLGILKLSKPLYLDVVLSDGSRGNLFNFDKSTTHKVMHPVTVGKINQPCDFSNLIINGDFICENAKSPIVFPQRVNGKMGLVGYKFPFESVPDGVTEINFTYTVNSFANLNKLTLPDSLNQIWISDSVINNMLKNDDESEQIKIFAQKHPRIAVCNSKMTRVILLGAKNFANINKCDFPKHVSEILIDDSVINNALTNVEELKQIQKFADRYPNIAIWDSRHKQSLYEALEQREQELTGKEKNPEPVVEQPKSQIKEKTSDWLSRKEIVAILSKDERFAGIDDLGKFVKQAMRLITVPVENKEQQGQPVPCVYVDNIEIVKQSVLQIIAESEQRTQNKEQKVKEKQQLVKPIKSEQPKTQEKLVVLEIEKYIPKNVWKDICDSCKDSVQLKISVLEEISKINLDYTKQHTRRAPVQYVDNNDCVAISKIQKREGMAAVQNVGTKRKCIVWTINPSDKILVAIAFLEEHAESTKAVNNYSTARTFAAKCQNTDGILVTRDLIDQGEYFNVSDLLKELQKKDKVAGTIPVIETPDVPAEPEIVDVPEEAEPVVSEKTEPVVKQTTTRRLIPVSSKQPKKRRSNAYLKAEEERMEVMSTLLNLGEEIENLMIGFDENEQKASEQLNREIDAEQLDILEQLVQLVTEKKDLMRKYGLSIPVAQESKKESKKRTLVDLKAAETMTEKMIKEIKSSIQNLRCDFDTNKNNPEKQLEILDLCRRKVDLRIVLNGKYCSFIR